MNLNLGVLDKRWKVSLHAKRRATGELQWSLHRLVAYHDEPFSAQITLLVNRSLSKPFKF